jgi:uncharacterized protein (DUF1697 family)
MPALREALSEDYGAVSTYLQSGNVVLSSADGPEDTRRRIEQVIEQRFGFAVDVLMRTGEDLAAVVRHNPLGKVAENPKRYQVTFLEAELSADRVAELAALAKDGEQLAARGRELYAWHPNGVARSKLWAKLGSTGLDVLATSRNWATVTALLALADEE